MSNFPIVPLVAILTIFALPYLVIFLQAKRLKAVENKLSDLSDQVSLLNSSLNSEDSNNA